MCKFKIMV